MTLQTADFITHLVTAIGVVIGGIFALWKTGVWFGRWTSELQAVRTLLTEGFDKNDEAHQEIHRRISTLEDEVRRKNTKVQEADL